MKKKWISFIIAGCMGLQLHAQNTIPPKTTFTAPAVAVKSSRVSDITILQDSVTTVLHAGVSTNMFHFKGTIRSSGPGQINYKWVITSTSKNNVPPLYKTGSITPGGTGIDNVFTDCGNASGGLLKIVLTIVSPDQITSNSLTY